MTSIRLQNNKMIIERCNPNKLLSLCDFEIIFENDIFGDISKLLNINPSNIIINDHNINDSQQNEKFKTMVIKIIKNNPTIQIAQHYNGQYNKHYGLVAQREQFYKPFDKIDDNGKKLISHVYDNRQL